MKRPLLMLAGPTEIEPEILRQAGRPLIYYRSPEFSKMMLQISTGLKYLFQTKNHVFILNCSGTGAMEAAVVNTLRRGDKVIVVNGGVFGERWAKICRGYGLKVVELKLPLGQSPQPQRLKELLRPDIKALFVTTNETSTGAFTDVRPLAKMVQKTKTILVVDAISSLGAEKLLTDKWALDVVVASSQKALGLPPGLSFITFSPKAERMRKASNLPKFYFDLKEYQRFILLGQFPFTPTIPLLYQLSARLKKIRKEGLDKMLKRYSLLTQALREEIKALGLSLIGPRLANSVTGVMTPDGIKAGKIIDLMRERYNIILPHTFGDLKDRLFRIGTFGYLNKSDVTKTITALKVVLLELGYKIKK